MLSKYNASAPAQISVPFVGSQKTVSRIFFVDYEALPFYLTEYFIGFLQDCVLVQWQWPELNSCMSAVLDSDNSHHVSTLSSMCTNLLKTLKMLVQVLESQIEVQQPQTEMIGKGIARLVQCIASNQFSGPSDMGLSNIASVPSVDHTIAISIGHPKKTKDDHSIPSIFSYLVLTLVHHIFVVYQVFKVLLLDVSWGSRYQHCCGWSFSNLIDKIK